jgi:hypothetical protein
VPKQDHDRILGIIKSRSDVRSLEDACGVDICRVDGKPGKYRVELKTPAPTTWRISRQILQALTDAILKEESNEFVKWSGWMVQSELIVIPRALFTEFVNHASAVLGEVKKISS